MEFHKATVVSLRNHPELSEVWLHGLIKKDPGILGLGDLEVRDSERRQPRAGRVDLLLVDPESTSRYVVELQLGRTDESHIIRTIEYWDLERKRYPQYDHIAVLVAEDVTSRFLNVIGLFNGTIPIIAIQLQALEVNGILTLSASRVVDVVPLGTDEEDEGGGATDRPYWIQKSSAQMVVLADRLLALIQEVDPGVALKYNKHYIGLAHDGVPDNYIDLKPRKHHIVMEFRIPQSDSLTMLLDEAGLDVLGYAAKWGRQMIRVTEPDLESSRDTLLELVRQARGDDASI